MRSHLAVMVAALLMPAVGAAQTAAPVGQPRFLDTTPDRPSTPAAINNYGDVAGWHVAEDGDNYHAFVWSERTGFVDIGTLGGAASQALDINDLGQVLPRPRVDVTLEVGVRRESFEVRCVRTTPTPCW